MRTVTVDQRLLTEAWQDDAGAVVAALRTSTRQRALPTGCRVVLFELAGDRDLHVNVTHQRSTSTPAGWSGPGVTPDGFVHNRRFPSSESHRIARQIHEMVYAPPHRAAVLLNESR
jgi:hypothetical protein